MSAGAVFILCIALSFILFFPVAPIQWLSILVIILLATSFAYSRVMFRSVRVVRRRASVKAFKYEYAVIEIEVENRSILPFPYLVVVDNAGGFHTGNDDRAAFGLGPRERRLIAYQVKGYNRGEYRLGPVRLLGSDPFGLFPWRAEFPAIGSLVIYPTVHPVTVSTTDGIPSGSLRVTNPIYEDITNYRSLREYIPGDDPRKINWKVSARTGTLHTMEYLPAVYYPAIVLLNLTAADYVPRNRYHHSERTIEAAASLVSHLTSLGLAVGLFSTGVQRGTGVRTALPIQSGYGHSIAILEALSRIEISESGDDIVDWFFASGAGAAGAANPGAGTRVFYIGPRLTAERRSALVARKGQLRFELCYTDEGVEQNETFVDSQFHVYRIPQTGERILE